MSVERKFEEFAMEVQPSFRPPGVQANLAGVRRRRRNRYAVLAATVALAVAMPTVLLSTRNGSTPVTGTSPSVHTSATVAATPSALPLLVDGKRFGSDEVYRDIDNLYPYFTDRNHGWLFLDGTLARTTDGGRLWRRVALPDPLSDSTSVYDYPLDNDTLVLYYIRITQNGAHEERWFQVSKDDGAHFTKYPYSSPPIEALLAVTRGRPFRIGCPKGTGYEDGAFGIECPEQKLIKIGVGPMPNQHPLAKDANLWVGRNGWLWLVGEQRAAARSTNGGRDWTKLPTLPVGVFHLSPDGTDAWITGDNAVWQLDGKQWRQRPGLPKGDIDPNNPGDGPAAALALGADRWLIVQNRTVSLVDADRVVTPLFTAFNVGWMVLSDDTIVCYERGVAVHLGRATGSIQDWTTYRY